MIINIISNVDSWLNKHLKKLSSTWNKKYEVNWVHDSNNINKGDLCFILSYYKLLNKETLSLNKHNLVVHESNLPTGKGWSPLTWQIINNINVIDVCLLEAEVKADSGMIYLREELKFEGNELIEDLRSMQANATINLCNKFIKTYPDIIKHGKKQHGEETFYKRRVPECSRLNPKDTIENQFNLLRVVDNDMYPAFFDLKGYRYKLLIEKVKKL